jgi:transcriptional regulator GlxA family with amidase domain
MGFVPATPLSISVAGLSFCAMLRVRKPHEGLGVMPPYHVAFCVVPDFPLTSLAIGLDVLRVTNRMTGRPVFRWTILSRDGQPVRASTGTTILIDGALASARRAPRVEDRPDMVFVVAGLDVERHAYAEIKRWLGRVRGQGAAIGAIAAGTYILAAAGLLDDRNCTIHWENMSAFTEHFPLARVKPQLWAIDGDIHTCAGSSSVMDLMLQIVTRHTDAETAGKVAEQCLVTAIRRPEDSQRAPIGPHASDAHPVIAAASRIMERHIEEPLALKRLAGEVGLSLRQIERLFHGELGRSPAEYYRHLRLERAKHLLAQTRMPVLEVALASGFASAAHFSKSYRRQFGQAPTDFRRVRRVRPGR